MSCLLPWTQVLFFLLSHPPSLRPHSLIQCQPSPAVSDPSARSLSSGWRWDSSEASFCWPSPSSPPPDRKQVSVLKLWEKSQRQRKDCFYHHPPFRKRENSVSQDIWAPITTFGLLYYVSISFNESWSSLGMKNTTFLRANSLCWNLVNGSRTGSEHWPGNRITRINVGNVSTNHRNVESLFLLISTLHVQKRSCFGFKHLV